jgi:hypothetical protein
LNWDIVDAMSTVKELVLRPDGIVFEPLDVVVDEDEDEDELLQAAAARHKAAARPTQPSRRERLNGPWPCERESQPPSLLLPSRIP